MVDGVKGVDRAVLIRTSMGASRRSVKKRPVLSQSLAVHPSILSAARARVGVSDRRLELRSADEANRRSLDAASGHLRDHDVGFEETPNSLARFRPDLCRDPLDELRLFVPSGDLQRREAVVVSGREVGSVLDEE